MSDLSYKKLGQYQLQGKVGTGGIADIYLAMDTERGHEVALKLLQSRHALSQRYYESLVEEARHLEQLRHKHIVRFYGFERFGDLSFIVMEYVDGESLKDFLSHHPDGLRLEHILSILQPIASALHYIHHQHRVHRDVKPGNILLSKNNEVFLTDLGITGLAGILQDDPHQPTGTPGYMSPEQCMASVPDHRSDIYALGLVVYHMLTGYPAFRGQTTNPQAPNDTADRIMWQQLNEYPIPVSQVRRDISPKVDHILERALAKNPAQRYQEVLKFAKDMAELLEQAQAVIGGETVVRMETGTDVGGETNTLSPPEKKRNSIPYVLTAAILIVVATVGAILWKATEPTEQVGILNTQVAEITEETNRPTSTRIPSSTPIVTSTRRPSAIPRTGTSTGAINEPESTSIQVSPTQTDTPVTPTKTNTPRPTRTATRKPSPTNTPQPTQTPISYRVRVSDDSRVNVREEDNISSRVLITLEEGQQVNVIGKNWEESWLYTEYAYQRTGWVRTDLIQISNSRIRLLPVYTGR